VIGSTRPNSGPVRLIAPIGGDERAVIEERAALDRAGRRAGNRWVSADFATAFAKLAAAA